MEGVVLLRKLAEKSKINFGKYKDLTIREILNLNHPNYIRWIYFNMSGLSFVDDILEEVKVPEIYRIKKPGKNKELFEKLEGEIFGRMHGLDKFILEGINRKQRKRNYINAIRRDYSIHSPDSLVRVNHGHETHGERTYKEMAGKKISINIGSPSKK